LSASDDLSGVENIYFSVNGSAFQPYLEAIRIEDEKEYGIKYYAADNVGNVENLHEVLLVYDKTPPVTKLNVVGDRFENILSGRSKIELITEDKTAGVKSIFYSIDSGSSKVYSLPIPAAYLSQDEHIISYYSADHVGNTETSQNFIFTLIRLPRPLLRKC
jgi:hypothetical protein